MAAIPDKLVVDSGWLAIRGVHCDAYPMRWDDRATLWLIRCHETVPELPCQRINHHVRRHRSACVNRFLTIITGSGKRTRCWTVRGLLRMPWCHSGVVTITEWATDFFMCICGLADPSDHFSGTLTGRCYVSVGGLGPFTCTASRCFIDKAWLRCQTIEVRDSASKSGT